MVVVTLLSAAIAANIAPVASVILDRSELTLGEVIGASAAGSVDPDAGPESLSFEWVFGDGVVASGRDVTHVYATSGAYDVELRVFDGEATSYASRRVVVLEPVASSRGVASAAMALVDRELWVANADSNTVSRVNVDTGRVDEYVACSEPRSITFDKSQGLVWVTCRSAAQIIALSTFDGRLQKAMDVGLQPHSIAFDPGNDRLYVALEGESTVVKIHPQTLATLREWRVRANPRAVAINHDRLLVSHFLSRGNVGWLTSIDLSVGSVSEISLAEDRGPDSASSGRGIPNLLGVLAWQPNGRSLWFGGVKSNTSRGAYVSGQALTPSNRVRGLLGVVESDVEQIGRRIDTIDADSVSGIASSANGRYLYVSHRGKGVVSIYEPSSTDRVQRGDSAAIPFVSRLSVGDAPQDIIVDPQLKRIYVHVELSRAVVSINVEDPLRPAIEQQFVTTREPLSAEVAEGKRLFNSSAAPSMSRSGYVACASCHPDGGHDGRTWDFTQQGEGLRNTIDLRGRRGLGDGPLHWSANFDEVQDFEHDIRGSFGGAGLMDGEPFAPLGAHNAGRSVRLDALAAYVGSLAVVPESPWRTRDGGLSEQAKLGRTLFNDPSVGCADCHSGARFTDSNLFDDPRRFVVHDVGTLLPGSGQRLGAQLQGLDTPSLVGAWCSPPYLHDGRADSILAVIREHNPGDLHGVTSSLSDEQVSAIEAFVLSLDSTEDAQENADAKPVNAGGCNAAGFGSASMLALLALGLRRRSTRRG